MAMQKLQRTQQPAAKASTPAKQKSFGSTGGEYRGTGNTATQSRSSGENEFANALATVTSSNAVTDGPASIRTPELDSAVGNTNATGPLAASADPSNWTGDAALYLQMGGDVDRATVRGLELFQRRPLADASEGIRSLVNTAGYLSQGSMGGIQNDPTLSGDAAMYIQAFGDEIPEVESLKRTTNFGQNFQNETQQLYGDITGGWKVAGDVAGTIGRMAPGMALNLVPGVGQALSGAYLFGSAAGSAMEEAAANGANPYEAMQYGIASGAVEAATEKLFDGMAGLLGRGAADDVVESVIGKLTAKNGSAALRNALRLGFGALGEGAEEGISALADPILRSIYNNQTVRENYRDIDWGDVLYQIELGALSGGVLGSLGMANGQFRGKNAALNQRVVTEVVNDVLTNSPEGQATAQRAQEAVSAENPLTQTILANEQGQQEQGSEFNTPQTAQRAEDIPAPTPVSPTEAAPQESAQPVSVEQFENLQTEFDRRKQAWDEANRTGDPNYPYREEMQWLSQAQTTLDQNRSGYFDALSRQRQESGKVSPQFGQPENYIGNRDMKSVGDTRVKAFQFDHPELHPYYLQMAQEVAADVANQMEITTRSTKNGWYTIPANNPLIQLLQEHHVTRKGTMEALERIMQDNGREDAAAKRAEIYLHGLLVNGYQNVDGTFTPPNQAYIDAISRIPGAMDRMWSDQRNAYEGSFIGSGMTDAEIEAEMQKWDAEHPRPTSQTDNQVGGVVPGTEASPAPTAQGPQGPALQNGPADRSTTIPQQAPAGNSYNPQNNPVDVGQNAPTAAAEQQTERPGTTVSRVAPAPSGAEGTNLSASVETVRNAKVTTDEMRALIDRSVADGGSRYFPITNDETLQKATNIIQQKGWDKALADWTADARTGKTSAEMQVVGQLLFNNAVNAGDLDLAMDIYTDYRASGTNTAQALQARRILSNMAPQARLYKMERTVQSMLDELGNAVPEGVKISDELKQEFLNAPDEQTRDEVIGKIQKDLARQMPVTFLGADGRISWKNVLRKWTALRYLNMLGNLKTQGRNIFGNFVNAALYTLKNEVQAGIEGLAYAASGGKYERRTSAIVTDRNLIRAGMDYYKAHADAIGGESRLSDNLSANAFQRGIEENQRVFTTPVIGQALEIGRRGTKLATERGDTIFIGPRFARTLAGYLQANGIDVATFTGIQDGSIQPTAEQRGLIDRAVNYATQEAQEATFHDHNVISDTVANIGRGEKTWKPLKVIAEGIMPFRRTPANIAVRMEEFSPLGFVNAAVKAIQASKGNSNVTGADVINSLAKATTGTGLFLLGVLLRNAGWLRGKEDDDKQEAFDRMQGEQDYSLVLPDGTSLTMDWVAPSSGVLFTGAQFADALADGKLTGNDLQKVLSSITDPMVEMSMLQGINDALENIRYADSNIFEFAMSSAISYLTQGLTSTLAGQAERTVEDHRTETYVDTESWLPRSVQRQLGKFGEKSPFFDYNQVEFLDAWGRPQMYEDNAFGRALENFTSPAYISGDNSTAVDDELQRLYDAGMGNVFPQRISMTDKISTYDAHGQKTGERQLTADEYVQVQRQAGQGSLRMVQDLMGSAMYDAMSDEAKAEAISAIYQYNKYQALRGVEPSMKDEYAEVAGLSNIPAYFAVQKAYNDATDNRWARDYAEAQDVMESYSTLPQDVRAYIEGKDSQVRKVHEAYEQGVQPRSWFQVYDKVHDLTPYGDNASVSAWQKYETVVQTSPQQADALLQSYMDESTYARYQVAREFGVSPELFTDYYREKALNNGRKDDCINWMLSQGYSKKQAEYMYYLFKTNVNDLSGFNAGYR